MCGFGVELRRDRAPDRAALERMHAALAPRGPDGDGIWLDGNAGMVHRRLAIIDLSELGAQPMRDDALSRARQAASGKLLCLTDSYRDFAGQVDVFRRKPNLAATPGRSQHGWGLAVDLGCGVQGFGSEAHRWMQANGPAYGWIHPAWAQIGGSRPEAWHWEYVGS